MGRHLIAPREEFTDGSRRILRIPGVGSVGVFNVGGSFFALKNACPHQGAPLCLGSLGGTGRALWNESGGRPHIEWIRDEEVIRCPWHGWEFDVQTGRAIANSDMRVKIYTVHVVQVANLDTELAQKALVDHAEYVVLEV